MVWEEVWGESADLSTSLLPVPHPGCPSSRNIRGHPGRDASALAWGKGLGSRGGNSKGQEEVVFALGDGEGWPMK